jgi:primosomal protein N' (replication factor Y) (superfamily II helicase)
MNKYLEVAFNLPLDRTFTYLLPEGYTCLPGSRVKAPFRGRELLGCVMEVKDEEQRDLGYAVKQIKKVLDEVPILNGELLDLARWMGEMYFCGVGEAVSAMMPGAKQEREMELGGGRESPHPPIESLSPGQMKAKERVLRGGEGFYYLYGVTGSGKTEVFLQIADALVREGRGVIYLVPEISLTHQTAEVLRSRFGDSVALLHSGLTASQRLKEWGRVQKGEAQVVVGARSAVFAPIKDLGLIIIDEEHESSYKSGRTPRYHARQVAMRRCTLAKGTVIMGSATPSAEAFHAMENKRIEPLFLEERLVGSMPAIELVDMNGKEGPLSDRLIEEIRNTAKEGRQTILFLNRRGFSYFFHCKSCGWEMTCRHCSVALTYHKKAGRMVCHYCGYTTSPVGVCPSCGSLDVGYSGFGTERVEEELKLRFSDLHIDRIDADSVKRRGEVKKKLEAFRAGKTDILLGTQMVAKGLNFPGVKLVGIVLADTGLHLPDFRAEERTFSLIVQVSGRAGRSFPDGKVLVQTFRPEHDAITMATEGKMRDFYSRELKIRRDLGFPPFTRIIRIVFRGKEKEATQREALEFSKRINKVSNLKEKGGFRVLGPAECPIGIIASNYRYQIMVSSPSFRELHGRMKRVLKGYLPQRGVYAEIDVDPASLL